jgi:hypothetical protein
MARKDPKEHMNNTESNPEKRSGDTHSGTPNPVDPNKARSTEHKSGYGGEGGNPRSGGQTRKSGG